MSVSKVARVTELSQYSWSRPLTDEEAKRLCAPLGITALGRCYRIALDVRDVARASLQRSRPPRLTEVRTELRSALALVRDNPNSVPTLSQEAQDFVHAVSASTDPELPVTAASEASIKAALTLLEFERKSRHEHKGGRPSDPRILRFVVHLAQVFVRETGNRPTHTICPGSGELCSAFDNFVLQACRLYYPGQGPFPLGAIESAIRQTVVFERDSEEFMPRPFR